MVNQVPNQWDSPTASPRGETVVVREARASFTETVRDLKLGLTPEKQGGRFQLVYGLRRTWVWLECQVYMRERLRRKLRR